jgi:ubiquitin-like-conjugating enzyme ATG3
MEFIHKIATNIVNTNITRFNHLAEYFVPILENSEFLDKGVLTPEEFIYTGDKLTYLCKTWVWGSGIYKKQYLPDDKQFILIKNVSCIKYQTSNYKENKNGDNNELYDWQTYEQEQKEETQINDFDLENMEQDNHSFNLFTMNPDQYIKVTEAEDNLIKTKSYDITITYDKYYRTPRVWINGYDENNQPLLPEVIIEDMSIDHSYQSITIEQHPHLDIVCISIHPCNHSTVMKTMIDKYIDSGKEIKVEDYMFLFLKFISCIMPNINYDFTLDI